MPLRKLAPDVPIALAELITECMQPDPRLRLRSMREVLQRLDALALPAWTADDSPERGARPVAGFVPRPVSGGGASPFGQAAAIALHLDIS